MGFEPATLQSVIDDSGLIFPAFSAPWMISRTYAQVPLLEVLERPGYYLRVKECCKLPIHFEIPSNSDPGNDKTILDLISTAVIFLRDPAFRSSLGGNCPRSFIKTLLLRIARK